jgi:Mrp family chromosome partitioning ATPase
MIISLVSQKGGVGKTALARLLAVEFARSGWDVKLVDLDTARYRYQVEGAARSGRASAGDRG